VPFQELLSVHLFCVTDPTCDCN